MLWIVTVKDDKNPAHDPRNKVTAECSVTDVCTDATGAHHSYIMETPDETTPDDIRARLGARHVTRIEKANIVRLRDWLTT